MKHFLLGLVLVGCPAVEKLVVIRSGDPCIFIPPPATKFVSYEGPPSCPEAFVTCLDARSATALADNIEASHRWETEAWIRCGPVPDAGTP